MLRLPRLATGSRLLAALELDDGELLLDATAGRRKAELRARWERFDPSRRGVGAAGVESICRHCDGWPPTLAPIRRRPVDAVRRGRQLQRLRTLTSEPVVAIVGSRRATDYGMEMARSLARGLAASGVVVTLGLSDRDRGRRTDRRARGEGQSADGAGRWPGRGVPVAQARTVRAYAEHGLCRGRAPLRRSSQTLVRHRARTDRGRHGAADNRRRGRRGARVSYSARVSPRRSVGRSRPFPGASPRRCRAEPARC